MIHNRNESTLGRRAGILALLPFPFRESRENIVQNASTICLKISKTGPNRLSGKNLLCSNKMFHVEHFAEFCAFGTLPAPTRARTLRLRSGQAQRVPDSTEQPASWDAAVGPGSLRSGLLWLRLLGGPSLPPRGVLRPARQSAGPPASVLPVPRTRGVPAG